MYRNIKRIRALKKNELNLTDLRSGPADLYITYFSLTSDLLLSVIGLCCFSECLNVLPRDACKEVNEIRSRSKTINERKF